MAASIEEHDVVPIFLLPDELLMEIFSYITFIPEKMDLERVSKRIQYISSRPQSWKGIHKLKMDISCSHRLTYAGILLNDLRVSFVKWPAAIQLLLDRTHINELKFRCQIHNNTKKLDPTVFPAIIQVFNQNRLKMKPKILKCLYLMDVNEFCWILIRSLEISLPYLEQFSFFAYGMDDVGTHTLTEIWPIISKCNSLKSFLFECRSLSIDWTALIGKPLKKLIVYGARNPGNNDLDNLIEVINNAKGEGIHTLNSIGLDLIPQNNPQPFKYFCDLLNENSRKQLRAIRRFRVKVDEINHLYLIPSIFPNLEYIGILMHYSTAIDIDEFCTMAVSFLNLAHSQLSNCKMDFIRLKVEGGNKMQLKDNLQIASQNEEITVEFDDMPEVLLSKGNASIEIQGIYEL